MYENVFYITNFCWFSGKGEKEEMRFLILVIIILIIIISFFTPRSCHSRQFVCGRVADKYMCVERKMIPKQGCYSVTCDLTTKPAKWLKDYKGKDIPECKCLREFKDKREKVK
jgi:hypothetical protein